MMSIFLSGWLVYLEHFFGCRHGQNAIFNTMRRRDKAMDAMIDGAGRIVEERPTERVLAAPAAPHPRDRLSVIPQPAL